MVRYEVKLNAWTESVLVEARSAKAAAAVAELAYPSCDCCGSTTFAEWTTKTDRKPRIHESVLLEVS